MCVQNQQFPLVHISTVRGQHPAKHAHTHLGCQRGSPGGGSSPTSVLSHHWQLRVIRSSAYTTIALFWCRTVQSLQTEVGRSMKWGAHVWSLTIKISKAGQREIWWNEAKSDNMTNLGLWCSCIYLQTDICICHCPTTSDEVKELIFNCRLALEWHSSLSFLTFCRFIYWQ